MLSYRTASEAARGLASVASLAIMLGTASLAQAQDKVIELKLSHWVPPSHPLHPALEAWAADIEKESHGTIKSKIFPAQQLGKAFDHYDMARDGIADFTYVNPGYQPGRFPIVGAGELPFLISNAKAGSKAFDIWYRKYADKEMKDVKYCLGFLHDPGTFHSRTKKIMVPADIKGMKIRPAHATIAAWMTQLGGTNVQAAAPEVRDVIERGVADAVTFPWGSIPLFGIDKVTKYHMEAALYVTTFAWVMNKDKYNSMSAAQKKVIDNHCTPDWALKLAAPWADFEHAGIAKIKAEPGHEVYTITSEQLAEWRKSAEPLHKSWADSVKKAGGNPDQVMSDLQSELKKADSAY